MPALVTVNVESRSSSGWSVPARAPSASRWSSASISATESRSQPRTTGHDETRLGVDGDAEVVAVEQHDLVVVDPRVQLRELCERTRRGPQRGRDEEIEVDAGEVAFLDERHGRDLAVRALDLLDDRAPDAAHRHPPPLERSGRGANVGLGHAAARARAL